MHRERTEAEAITGGQSGKAFSMNRKAVIRGVGLVVLGVLLSLNGCESVSSETNRNLEKGKESKAMEMTQTKIVHTPTIPPIDASAPNKTATATFALG